MAETIEPWGTSTPGGPEQPQADPQAPSAAPPEPVEPRPPGILAPLYLLIRPQTFFRHFTSAIPPLVIFLCVWVYGMVGAIDRIDTDHLLGRGRYNIIHDSWGKYFGLVVTGGLIAGLVYYAVGGWWYRVRLRFSGDSNPDPFLARRVYVLSGLIVAVPALLVVLIESSLFPRPLDAMNDESTWYLLLLALPFWSVFVSFGGVRALFRVKPLPAVIWFAALPSVLYAVAFIAIVGMSIWLTWNEEPDLGSPQVFQSNTMRFEYPANWWLSEGEDHDPDHTVTIEPPQDATLLLQVFFSELTPGEELDNSLESLRPAFSTFRNVEPFQKWGNLEGVGQTVHADLKGTKYTVRVFVANIDEVSRFEVREIYDLDAAEQVQGGYAHVAGTMRLTPLAIEDAGDETPTAPQAPPTPEQPAAPGPPRAPSS